MIRTMLGVAIAAAVLTGCASKTQNTTPTAPGAASEALPSVSASPAPASRPAASPGSGSLAFPAATAAPTAAASPSAAAEPATTASAGESAAADQSRVQPAASAVSGTAPNAAPPAAQSSASATSQQPASVAPASGSGSGGAAIAATAAATAAATGPTVAQVPAVDARELIDNVKLVATDLPSGYGLGGLQGYQTSEMAVNGYDNPSSVIQQMMRTGRAGGYIEQITTPDSSNGAGASVEVWQDAAGAKAYFDNFPRPAPGLEYQQIDVPGLGEQVFAYKYDVNGQTGYSIAWRRGRIIMGVGELVGSAGNGLERVLAVARLLDAKAQATAQ